MPPEYQLPEDMALSKCFKTVGNGVPFLAALGLAKSVRSILDARRAAEAGKDQVAA
jgi:DNA (cytosine-5)-methyltransferase 1